MILVSDWFLPRLLSLHSLLSELSEDAVHVERLTNVDSDQVTRSDDTGLRLVVTSRVGEDTVHTHVHHWYQCRSSLAVPDQPVIGQ